MHNSLKIIKTLLYSYSALHVSGTLAPIIRSLLILHIQPPVTMCRWVGCIFQLWSVAFAFDMYESMDSLMVKLYFQNTDPFSKWHFQDCIWLCTKDRWRLHMNGHKNTRQLTTSDLYSVCMNPLNSLWQELSWRPAWILTWVNFQG
jgi:hypothetical protein